MTINKKYEKREAAREKGAEKAAQVERAIEKELLQRLKSGTFYPKEIYNLDAKQFEKHLDEEEVEEAEQYDIDEEADEEAEDE